MKTFFKHIFSRITWKKRGLSIVRWSKKFTLPGFNEIPVYDIFNFIYEELKKDDLPTRANSVAFSFFISIFPFVIFLLPLISSTPLAEQYLFQLAESMDDVFPVAAKDYFISVVEGIKSDGTWSLQSFGFILSIVFASSGMLTLMFGFDKSHSTSFKSRSYFKKRLVAINLTLLFALILFGSILLLVFSQYLINKMQASLELSWMHGFLLILAKWLIVVMLFYTVISVIYRYGPSIYRPLNLINPGSMLATFASIFASVGFSSFINNFGRYNEIYGSIGALLVTLLWFQINAFIILAGFELNASIIVNRDAKYQELKKASKTNKP